MGWDIVSGPAVGHWTAQRAGGVFSEANSTALGLQRAGRLCAGVMYENWNGKSIVAHMAASGRLTRAYLGAIFRYAFVTCGVEKVILPIASTNARCCAFAENLGFAEEARITDAAPDGHLILYTLKKSDCRFLGDKFHGKA